ncbi:GAF domain-containing protein [bacterium]|nr:GAF domain-containing protein [bacterium]
MTLDIALHPATLIGLGLVLDLQAQRGPVGLYRTALPFYLALAWLGYWQLALVSSLLGMFLLPALKYERKSAALGLLYVSAGTLILVGFPAHRLALVAVAGLGSLWGIGSLSSLSEDLQQRRLRRALLSFQLIWPWPLLVAVNGPLEALVMAAVLLSTSTGMVNAIHRIYATQATEAMTQRDRSEAALAEARQQLTEQQVTLALEARQRRIVEKLAEQLAEGPTFADTQKAVLDTLSRLMVARSVVLFLWHPTGSMLEPTCWNSPESEKLYQATFPGFVEPLVELCWSRGKLVRRQGDGQLASEVFRNEDHAMAVPLPELGVIYVGRESHPFSPADCHLLEWVAEKAGLGLRAAWRHHHQLEQQREQTSINVQLREHVQLLERLVQGTGWLSSQLTLQGTMFTLQRELPRLLGHDFAAVFLGPPDNLQMVHSWSNVEGLPVDTEAFQRIATVSLQRAASLLYADMEGQSMRSSLCVPFTEDPSGVILVAGQQKDAYQREQLQLLTLLALQLSVTLRNAQLYEEVQQQKIRLEQSQAQLIQSSKLTAIGQLAAGVAHELNTPLGAVSLSLDLMSLQHPEGNRHITNAQGAVERARGIVDKLLVYSRRTHLAEPEPVHLADVIVGASELVQSKIRAQRVTLTTETEVNPVVQAKLVELQQVVVNLMINAVDAYDDAAQDRKLTVACGQDNRGPYIYVRDFAGGIPDEVQSQIFDPFFTTKPIGKGTGLGLSISKEICAQYGCDLSFETKSGNGTTFTMRFPTGHLG